jgi:voltage-gated potassium channel
VPIFQRLIRLLRLHHYFRLRLVQVFLLALALNIVFGALFYLTEHAVQPDLTIGDGIWWAMVTMTTVGYGDLSPQTCAGRFLVAYPCMLFGIAIIGYFLGLAAENLFERISKRKRGLVQIKLENHVIICNFTSIDKLQRITAELRLHPAWDETCFVIVCDSLKELPDELSPHEFKFVSGNPTSEEVLGRANLDQAAGVFILAHDPANSDVDAVTFAIASVIDNLRQTRNLNFKLVAELIHKENLGLLKKAHPDGIVTPEGLTDCLLAQEFLYPGIHEIITQIVSNEIGSQFYIFDTHLAGYRVADVQIAVLEHPTNLQVIGIIKQGKTILNPGKEVIIETGDRLIMLAESRRDFSAIEAEILKNKPQGAS